MKTKAQKNPVAELMHEDEVCRQPWFDPKNFPVMLDKKVPESIIPPDHFHTIKPQQTDKELSASKKQLRDLNVYLESIREEERALISREIHDELGQALTILNLDSTWLYNHLSQDQQSLREKVESMLEMIGSTIKTIKRISTSLRPAILDDLGIAAAIEWQTRKYQADTQIRFEVDLIKEELNLTRKQCTTVFRIFQEAITNVFRHSTATQVKIILEEKFGHLILIIKDNGQGITEAQLSGNRSLGILGMKERAHLVGGKLKIRGIPDRGTTVTMIIPLEEPGGEYD